VKRPAVRPPKNVKLARIIREQAMIAGLLRHARLERLLRGEPCHRGIAHLLGARQHVLLAGGSAVDCGHGFLTQNGISKSSSVARFFASSISAWRR
jgi:hypothetical protein